MVESSTNDARKLVSSVNLADSYISRGFQDLDYSLHSS